MALRKTLTSNHRLFNLSKISSPSLNLTQSHSPFPPDDLSKVLPDTSSKTAAGSSGGFLRRFLQKRPIVQSAMKQELLDLPTGDKLMDKLRGMNVHGNRLRLDGLISPSPVPVPVPVPSLDQISVEDAKKLLRLAQLETVKSMLRSIPKTSISYSEFLQICKEGSGSDQGSRLAKTLDESGAVIVLRDTVFLRPEQITKAIEGVIPLTVVRPNDPRREELTKMEKEKAAIDEEAEALVRKELWAGLGFLIVQTAGFMRLTFWELSWDVMEPVCFYVTSMYFMAGYTFFLRTSKDPSFEGFFESRFSAKQKRLMKVKKFDVERFNELKRAFYPYSSEPSAASASSFERTLMCAH